MYRRIRSTCQFTPSTSFTSLSPVAFETATMSNTPDIAGKGTYFLSLDRSISSVQELFEIIAKDSSGKQPLGDDLNAQAPLDALEESGSIPATGGKTITPQSARVAIHALIIGINTYAYQEPLKGARLDAMMIEEYLKSDLKVPQDQITLLLDTEATRAGIIQAFKDMRHDTNIQKGDAIVIYYAGHGTELAPPKGWEAGGRYAKIQAIIPQDQCDIVGKEVPVIPDRTIGAIINGIAKEKGDNITVIFDSCYSGSGTRGETVFRCAKVKGYLPEDVDADILAGEDEPAIGSNSRSSSIAVGYENTGLSSHVLIAACSSMEKAGEVSMEFGTRKEYRGKFTVAFLDLLRRDGADKLTYVDIPSRMPVLDWDQSPQVEGVNIHRFLFNAKGPRLPGAVYEVKVKGGRCIINAGIEHAVSAGAQYVIYQDRDALQTGSQLGKLQVASDGDVRSHYTILSPLDDSPPIKSVPQGAIAIQVRIGERPDLRVYVEIKETNLPIFRAILQEHQQTVKDRYRIEVVESRGNAHLELKIEDDALVINHLDNRFIARGLLRIPATVSSAVGTDLGKIQAVLHSAAHFYRHFDVEVTARKFSTSRVTVECYELDESEEQDESGEIILTAIGNNLVKDGVVDITLETEDDMNIKYGFKITNTASWGLHVYAFLFEGGSFEVAQCYSSQVTEGNRTVIDGAVRKGSGTLTIGYGAGGGSPRRFSLRPNVDLDVSFLKFYFSVKPINLSSIPQDSPFGSRELAEANRIVIVDDLATLIIPVVQRRYAA